MIRELERVHHMNRDFITSSAFLNEKPLIENSRLHDSRIKLSQTINSFHSLGKDRTLFSGTKLQTDQINITQNADSHASFDGNTSDIVNPIININRPTSASSRRTNLNQKRISKRKNYVISKKKSTQSPSTNRFIQNQSEDSD